MRAMRRVVSTAFAVASAVAVLGSAAPATAADCVVYRNKADFKAPMVVNLLAASGQDCRVYFPLSEDVVVDVNRITRHPFYGGARVYGTSGVYYRSNPGYRGPDALAFEFCGRNKGEPVCARVRIKVDVR